jgi:hypothetical protein
MTAKHPYASLLALAAICSSPSACTTEEQVLQQSRLGDFSRFGRSIEISGNRAVVGAYQEDGGKGAVYVFTRSGDTWSLDARIVSPNPDDEQFGDDVAISGNTIAIGAPLDDQPGAFRSGSVYVYTRSGSAWALQAMLSSPLPHQAWEAFGVEIALDGNLLAVGAVDRDQGAATDAGAVFVYERSGSAWPLLQQLAAPSPVSQDKYGNAIDIVGQTLTVAALRRENGRTTDAGAVFVYNRPGATFTLAQTLVASDPAANGIFGSAIALESLAGGARRILIGASNLATGGFSSAGAAYVFDAPAAGAFTQTQKLTASDPSSSAVFGTQVALAGSRILIGAPGKTGSEPGSGAAYAFALSGTWSEQEKIERVPSDELAAFGSAVALFGAYALIGSTGESLGTLFDYTGTAHAYEDVAGSYAHLHALSAQGANPSNLYGDRIALGGERLAVSGRQHSDVYRRDEYGWSLEQHFPAGTNRVISSVDVAGETLALCGRRSPAPDPTQIGFVQVYTRTGDTWALQQELLPDLVSPTQQDESGNGLEVALEGDTLIVGARRWNGGDGRVFVYERSGSVWTQSQVFGSPQANTNFDMNFGDSVLLDGNTLVVTEDPSSGVPGSLQNGNVFIYTRANGTADFVQQQVLTAPVPALLDHYGAAAALDDDLLAVYGGGGLLRVYRRTAGTFSVIWTSPAPVPDVSAGVGTLAMSGDLLAIGSSLATINSAAGAGEVRIIERQPDDSYAEHSAKRASATVNQNLGRSIAFDGVRVVASTSALIGRIYDYAL